MSARACGKIRVVTEVCGSVRLSAGGYSGVRVGVGECAGGCGSVQNVHECTRMYASALDCAGAYGSVRSVQEYTGVL